MTGDEERYGSLLMQGEHLPPDRHGFPYQVILVLRPGGDGVRDCKRDAEARALAWVRDERREPVQGPDGRPLTEPVPPEVQLAAEEWLARQQDPDYVPVPWWEPGDRIVCSYCHDVRRELDVLLD